MTTPNYQTLSNKRALFLGDIENLAWDPITNTITSDSVKRISNAVQTQIGQNNIQEVIATSHYFAKEIWFAWGRTTRRLLGSGPDGADKKLVDLIRTEDIATRFASVIIGSGDGIFTEPVSYLAAQGLHITVAHGTGGLSKQLALAAHKTIELVDPAQPQNINEYIQERITS